LLLGIGAFRVVCLGNGLPGDRPSPVVSPLLGQTVVAQPTVASAASPERGAGGTQGSLAQATHRASPVPSPTPSHTVSSPTPARSVPTAVAVARETVAVPPSTGELGGPTPQDNPLTPTVTLTLRPTESSRVAEPTTEMVERPAPATRLVIPILGIDAPVVEVPISNKTWNVSLVEYEIAHLGGTANPGDKSNLVLAGHVTLKKGPGPFLNLESLQVGDKAIVYAGSRAYTYRVVSKRHVPSSEVSVAQPTTEAILTLITCTNWDAENRKYRERVAIVAELVTKATP